MSALCRAQVSDRFSGLAATKLGGAPVLAAKFSIRKPTASPAHLGEASCPSELQLLADIHDHELVVVEPVVEDVPAGQVTGGEVDADVLGGVAAYR